MISYGLPALVRNQLSAGTRSAMDFHMFTNLCAYTLKHAIRDAISAGIRQLSRRLCWALCACARDWREMQTARTSSECRPMCAPHVVSTRNPVDLKTINSGWISHGYVSLNHRHFSHCLSVDMNAIFQITRCGSFGTQSLSLARFEQRLLAAFCVIMHTKHADVFLNDPTNERQRIQNTYEENINCAY